MKIKNININSFGKLKNKSIDFIPGLNIIYGENESGKSTISSFIEAMLYSYPSRDAGRKKYIPWDETVSSGNMTIESNGETVTIYRKLTASSSKNELFPPDFTLPENFPRDRETFRKCVYCREENVSEFGRTNEIDARIANILTACDENINASEAIERLEAFKKSFTKKGGRLKDIENSITLLENELDLSLKSEKSVAQGKSEIEELNKKLSALSEKRDLLLSANTKAAPDELDKEIRKQEEYIATFPEDNPPPAPFRIPPWTALLYTLCALLPIIITFFTTPALSLLSLIPIAVFIVHFSLGRAKSKKAMADFLKAAGCSSFEEYKKMVSDKKSAEDYHSSLLMKKNALINTELKEKIRINEELNQLNCEMVTISDCIMRLKKASPPAVRNAIDITAELNDYRLKRDELLQKISAAEKAIEALTYAKNNLSKHLIPQIGSRAMEYINRIAPKEGRKITLEKDLSLLLTDPLPQDISSCSFGFKSEIYLCFRIALSEFLYGEHAPLILDDPFMGSDDLRGKALIDLFYFLSQNRQVIVFTNRKNPYYNQIKCNFVDITPRIDV